MTVQGERTQSSNGIMLDCTREEFASFVADGQTVIRASADLDIDVSPLVAYDTLATGEYAFLLESAEKVSAGDPDGAFQSGTMTHSDTDTGGRHARYSFVGYNPDAVVSVTPDNTNVRVLRDQTERVGAFDWKAETSVPDSNGRDTLDRLRQVFPDVSRRGFPDAERQLFDGGFVGFLAYDAVYDLWLDEVGVERPKTLLPDAEFVVTTRTLVFDHTTGSLRLVFTPILGEDDDSDEVYEALCDETERVQEILATVEKTSPSFDDVRITSRQSDPQVEYENAVEHAKEAVRNGDIYQTVISRTHELEGDIDPDALYASLRETNPSPYMYLLEHGDRTVVGASPETLVAVHDDTVINNPIAGTCPRGLSPVEDRRLAGEMLSDEKERSEHAMLVDLTRNDVRRVSEPGSVRVPEFMRVLKYSHVQHIESTVTGTLAAGADAFDAVRASFPAGTLSGAPKVRAMEYVHDLESSQRGIYGGGVGYVSWTGDAEFAIAIRSAVVESESVNSESGAIGSESRATDTVRVRAGAGVVADSDPTSEYEETESKMRGMLDAIEHASTPVHPEITR